MLVAAMTTKRTRRPLSARGKAGKARRNRAYYARNRAARRAYHRAYYMRNREKKNTKARANYTAKRAEYLRREKLYRDKNRLAYKIANAWRLPIDIVREMIANGESMPT
jgi:hypothetical protein